jgi:hypothetical protein
MDTQIAAIPKIETHKLENLPAGYIRLFNKFTQELIKIGTKQVPHVDVPIVYLLALIEKEGAPSNIDDLRAIAVDGILREIMFELDNWPEIIGGLRADDNQTTPSTDPRNPEGINSMDKAEILSRFTAGELSLGEVYYPTDWSDAAFVLLHDNLALTFRSGLRIWKNPAV